MTKLSWADFEDIMVAHKGECLEGCIVFTADSFDKPYTVKQRTYRVDSNANWFDGSKISFSLFGDCLDGTDDGVRLDWYIKGEKPWTVEYCYFE